MKRAIMQFLALVVFSLGLCGCFEPTVLGPPPGYEFDEQACADRHDNDGDHLVDCHDPDCLHHGLCSELTPFDPVIEPENSVERCSDRIDNDADGKFDCGDSDCTVIMETCCISEFDNLTCSNRVDDDRNGFADCRDNGCRRGLFVTACRAETLCNDGFDNDSDDAIDCDDSDCATTSTCRGGEDCANMVDDATRLPPAPRCHSARQWFAWPEYGRQLLAAWLP